MLIPYLADAEFQLTFCSVSDSTRFDTVPEIAVAAWLLKSVALLPTLSAQPSYCVPGQK